LPGFIVAQLIGAALGAIVFSWLLRDQKLPSNENR
jgi:glycerol uptake facilitator-like aquaporin